MTDQLQHRQREGGGLAGAGRRLSKQIPACEERGNRFALYGGGFLVAQVSNVASSGASSPKATKPGENPVTVGRADSEDGPCFIMILSTFLPSMVVESWRMWDDDSQKA